MKKIIYFVGLLCSISLLGVETNNKKVESEQAEQEFPKDGSDLFAGAFACAKDVNQCEKFKHHILGLKWYSRIPILAKFGAGDLNKKTPNATVQAICLKYILEQPGFHTTRCDFHEPFSKTIVPQRCDAVKEALIKAIGGGSDYFQNIKNYYQHLTGKR